MTEATINVIFYSIKEKIAQTNNGTLLIRRLTQQERDCMSMLINLNLIAPAHFMRSCDSIRLA